MVAEQRETVQRIDADTTDIAANVSGAQRELLKYYASVTSNRWLMLKIFGVLIIFVSGGLVEVVGSVLVVLPELELDLSLPCRRRVIRSCVPLGFLSFFSALVLSCRLRLLSCCLAAALPCFPAVQLPRCCAAQRCTAPSRNSRATHTRGSRDQRVSKVKPHR
jgi:hypothetical protein